MYGSKAVFVKVLCKHLSLLLLLVGNLFWPLGVQAGKQETPPSLVTLWSEVAMLQQLAGKARLEAVLLFKDLKDYDKLGGQSQRRESSEVLFGQTFWQGFTLPNEIKKLAEVARPGEHEPVPLLVGWFIEAGKWQVKALLGVSPGFKERLAALSPLGKQLVSSVHNTQITLKLGDNMVLTGTSLDASPWIFLAEPGSEPPPKIALVPALIPLKPALAEEIALADTAFVLPNLHGLRQLEDGILGDLDFFGESLRELANLRFFRDLIDQVETFVVTAQALPEQTTSVKVLFSVPPLADFVPRIPEFKLPQSVLFPLSAIWGAGATSTLGLNLSPGAIEALAPVLASQLSVQNESDPALLEYSEKPQKATDLSLARAVELFKKLSGRINLAIFDAPADWAVALEFSEPSAATAAFKLLGQYLERAPWLADLHREEQWLDPPARVWHISADKTLAGLCITTSDKYLVLSRQKARLKTVLKRIQELTPRGELSVARLNKLKEGALAGPLSLPMREFLSRPSWFTAYTVSGNDLGLLDWASAVGKQLRIFWQPLDPARFLYALQYEVDNIHLFMEVLGFNWLLTYDMAMALDVRQDLLMLEFRYSSL